MSEDGTITARTYHYGAMARQLIDSMAILMPGTSKTEIVNACVFRMVLEIKELMDADETKGTTIRVAYNTLREPLEDVLYQDLLHAVTPNHRNQTKLDYYIGKKLHEIEEIEDALGGGAGMEDIVDDTDDYLFEQEDAHDDSEDAL